MKKIYILIFAIALWAVSCKKDKEVDIHMLEVSVSWSSDNVAGHYASVTGSVSSGTLINEVPPTQRGICWSTSPNPSLDDNHTEDGEGYGNFNTRITGLQTNTTYYVRAYATNVQGTVYSDELSFKTRGNPDATLNGVEIYWNNSTTSAQKNTLNQLLQDLAQVEGGSFAMGAQDGHSSGSNYDSEAYADEQPVHNVTISMFFMSKHELTQSQWTAIMGSSLSWTTSLGKGNDFPAYNLSYQKAEQLIAKLNTLSNLHFSLPTEAQWEYAARGGSNRSPYRYSGSNDVDNVAWYKDNGSSKTHAVGSKAPNALGIYDMSGNVAELCQDYYDVYSGDTQTNPTGSLNGTSRVVRGGSWNSSSRMVRVSCRNYATQSNISNEYGVRLVINY